MSLMAVFFCTRRNNRGIGRVYLEPDMDAVKVCDSYNARCRWVLKATSSLLRRARCIPKSIIDDIHDSEDIRNNIFTSN